MVGDFKMRRIGRSKRRRKNKILIIGSLLLLLFLCVGYAAFSTNLSITAKGNIKEKSRVIQVWDENSQTDFHSDFYKENIVSVTFLDNNKVSNNATESWNVSDDKVNGGVMAWVVPNSSDNTKYDLYIGANGEVIANEDSSYLFYNFRFVNEISFNNNFDTSSVIYMIAMFRFCTSLKEIDLSSFDTKNVIEMGNLFCMFDNENGVVLENKLSKIIFGNNFSVEKARSLSQMFTGCYNLTSLDIANFNTGNVEDMTSVFAYCDGLTSIDVSGWNTSNVVDMSWMFFHCNSLTYLNLCNFDTEKTTSMNSMFADSPNLKKVTVGSNFSVVNVDTSFMFSNSGVSSVTYGEC